MKKYISILLAISLFTVFLTGCAGEDDYDDTYNTASIYLFPNTIVDDSDIPAGYDPHAPGNGDVSIEGRTKSGDFDMLSSDFVRLYNEKLPQHRITNTMRQTFDNGSYTIIKCVLEQNAAIYLYTYYGEMSNAFFAYPVDAANNGAMDYKEQIDTMISLFDPSGELNLDYLAKEIDVTSREEQEMTHYYILRKYMSLDFAVIDGIAYVGVGIYNDDSILESIINFEIKQSSGS